MAAMGRVATNEATVTSRGAMVIRVMADINIISGSLRVINREAERKQSHLSNKNKSPAQGQPDHYDHGRGQFRITQQGPCHTYHQ